MLHVTVCWSPAPRGVLEWPLDLPEGASVRDALTASGFMQAAGLQDLAQVDTGIWGRRCAPEQAVREGDRIEVYRALRVDPKVARRERFRKQGARAAGLFAQRRPGGKPGY